MINKCTKFEFNPSTSWGSYGRHRHNLLHGARSTTDTKPWHKHTTGELKSLPQNGANALNRETQKTYPGEYKNKQLRRSRQA